ncbi:MAG: hypothetical protein QME74_08845 [Candidatus Edwardsbacteria bacterium]|nr:hypothetical protein [Candidatus Edwardsbacteria bacterium]
MISNHVLQRNQSSRCGDDFTCEKLMKLSSIFLTLCLLYSFIYAEFIDAPADSVPPVRDSMKTVASQVVGSANNAHLPGKYHCYIWTGEFHPLNAFRIAGLNKELPNVLPESSIRLGFRYGLTDKIDLLAEYYGGYFQCGDSSTGEVLPTVSGPCVGVRYNFHKTKIIFNHTYPYVQTSVRYSPENISISKLNISEVSHGFSCGLDIGTDIRLSDHFTLPVGLCYFYGKAADNISVWEYYLGISINIESK